MEPRSKPKPEVYGGGSSEEFTRLKELAKQLVSVPKKDVQERERRARAKKKKGG